MQPHILGNDFIWQYDNHYTYLRMELHTVFKQ